MKKYNVTITETLKMLVEVEAETGLEAEQIVSDRWNNGEYLLDADNFSEVEFDAEDQIPKVEMSYPELAALFRSVNNKLLAPFAGYIVFTEDSFNKPYSTESRTYRVVSDNKAYRSGAGGYSIYASCLDGTDQCVRLEGYMHGDDAWKIEKCYMHKDDYERLIAALEPYTVNKTERDER